MPHAPAARTTAPDVVHKALRRFMFDALVRVGALDLTDRREVERSINLVQRLLTVVGEAAPEIQATLLALRHGGASQRRMRAALLYRELASLVTRQLQQIELHDASTRLDGRALRAWRRAQLAALADDELADALHWMAEALSPLELAELIDDLHTAAPRDRHDRALAALREQLPATRWSGVMRSLDALRAPATDEPLAA
jgi:hypothetical protein